MSLQIVTAVGVVLVLGIVAVGAGRRAEPRGRLVLVGTYTGEHSEGILAFRFDEETGALAPAGLAAATRNPSFLALHPNGRWVYAVNEVSDVDAQRGGSVTAFALDASSGRLRELNRQPSRGGSPCHLSVDRTGRALLVANYSGGNVTLLPIREDGSLGEPAAVMQHEGRSVHPERQKQPHAHWVKPDPGNRFAIASDLGIDQLLVYRLDPAAPSLQPHDPPSVRVPPGSGPRHVAFHPGGRWLYAINELQSTVTMFAWDGQAGTLEARQTLPTLPDGAPASSSTAEIAVHPSGRFVYGSNRGHDSIAVFAVDPERGTLVTVGHEPTRGRKPRHFAVDPSGRWLIAANQDSHTLAVFRIDPETGALAPHGEPVAAGAPVCVLFVP
jgi:6-phosphogluconolactonase